jgi:hypothetical protein
MAARPGVPSFARAAAAARGLDHQESIMCYEFSHWFTKARSQEPARKQAPQSEPSTQQATPAPEPQPVPAATQVREREATPA